MFGRLKSLPGAVRSRNYLIALMLALACSSSAAVDARSANNQQYQAIYNQIGRAYQDIKKADQELTKTMQLLRKRLRIYLSSEKSYSLLGADTSSRAYQRINQLLNRDLPKNPYQDIIPAQAIQKRVKLSLDPSISQFDAAQLRRKPRANWQDKPGSIHVIHNGYDFLILWAASYDGKPVKDKDSTRILTLKLRF